MGSELAGRTALVTGSGRNIGRAIALRLAQAGADLAVHAFTHPEQAERVAGEIAELGVRSLALRADLSDSGECRRLVESVQERFGALDVLVNNAAARPRQDFLSITPEDWERVIGSNLSAAFHSAQAALPAMLERGFGRIVNIGGPDGMRPLALRAHNVACKAGLVGLTKAIALEFGARGITANVVVPGITDTTRGEGYPGWPPSSKLLERELSIPRLGRSEEIAEACWFLCTPGASYVTGQTLHVNGGYYMP